MSSLASVWNSIQADKASHEENLNLGEAHKAAKIFYGSLLNPTSQRDVSELFKRLDKDKNGRVTKEELGKLLKESRAHSHLEYLFDLLDADQNGELSFEECITLYYLMQARPECDHCGKPLVGMFYTCVSCWDCKNATYSLCYNCFTSKNYTHAHQEFLDNYLALMRLLRQKITSNKIQCSVCGDIHDSNVLSFFPSGQHIVKREDGSGGYICEWCLKRSCSSCGGIFSSLQSDATPRQWLMNDFYCKRCGKPGNITDKSGVIEKLKRRCSDGSTPQCDNCYFKIKNGELFILPRVEKQFSKPVSKVVPASNNNTDTVAAQYNKGIGGFDIIDIAQMAFTVVQASKSQPSQEVSQASQQQQQCKLM